MERTPVHQRSVKDLPARDTWSALEKDLWKECKLGRAAVLVGKSDLPEDCDDDDRKVRAEFIRYLMWGGSDEKNSVRPHPKGVRIMGGWIEGALDLEACTSSLDLSLQNCRFEHPVTLMNARIGGLYLTGSHLLGAVELHRLTTVRDVHVRGGFRADGAVDLGGARIGWQLSCRNGSFLAETGQALNCVAAEIGADVFLSGDFEERAEVNFIRARVGGGLDCGGGKFLAKTGCALNCDTAEIGADVFLRDGFEAEGLVDFVRAQIAGHLLVQAEGEAKPRIKAGIHLEGARIGGGDCFGNPSKGRGAWWT